DLAGADVSADQQSSPLTVDRSVPARFAVSANADSTGHRPLPQLAAIESDADPIEAAISSYRPKGFIGDESETALLDATRVAVAAVQWSSRKVASSAMVHVFQYMSWAERAGISAEPAIRFAAESIERYASSDFASRPLGSRNAARSYLQRVANTFVAP